MADRITVDSRPYPWPWHGAFDPSRLALLVAVDGERGLPDEATDACLVTVTRAVRDIGVTIVELPDVTGRTVLPHALVDLSVTRPHFSGFTGTDLDSVLRRRMVTDLLIVGFPFELGADCTMRQANDRGYECLVITDCCTGMSPDTLSGAIASIQMSGGIFGAVADSGAILELLRRRRSPARPTTTRTRSRQ